MNTDSEKQHPITFTPPPSDIMKMSRRQLLTRSVALGGSFMVGGGFLAASSATWAVEVKGLEPEAMATLVQMARDVYPHDRFGDELYVAAVKGHDESAAEDKKHKALIEEGVASLDTGARERGQLSYLDTGWESDRVAVLESLEDSEFFQTVRSGLVVSLYNQEAVWAALGYEGSSYEHGGYINRGFDDINWL